MKETVITIRRKVYEAAQELVKANPDDVLEPARQAQLKRQEAKEKEDWESMEFWNIVQAVTICITTKTENFVIQD